MSLGALTTRFVPSASCVASNNLWQVWSTNWPQVSSSGPTDGWWWQIGPPINTDCFPPSYTQASTAFYSPAQCPSGYTPVQAVTNTYAGSLVETTQTCCPTGFPFSARTKTASSDFLTFPFFSTMPCEYGLTVGRDVTGTKTSSGTQQVFTDSIWSGGGVNAYGIVVRFQSTDFQTTMPTTTPPMTSNPTSSSSPTGSSVIPTPTPNSSSTGLSTGAKAGIGIGVALGAVAAIAGIVAFLLYRRRKARNPHEGRAELEQGAGGGDKEGGTWAHHNNGPQQVIEEMPANSWDLPERPPQELEGSAHPPLRT